MVLNLFSGYWKNVYLDTFPISLPAATVLQVLLKLTAAVEHRVSNFFNTRPSPFRKLLRFLLAWSVLLGSKFLILEAIAQLFGENVRIYGASMESGLYRRLQAHRGGKPSFGFVGSLAIGSAESGPRPCNGADLARFTIAASARWRVTRQLFFDAFG